MPKIETEIEGVSPLLQHRFPMEEADAKAKKKMGTVDYSKEAETSLYRDEEGTIYVPSTHLEAAMRDAAVNFRIQGGRGKTYKTIINAAVIVEPEAIPLLGDDGDPEWTVDARPVVIQRARVVRYRPKFSQWKLKFVINVLDEQLDVEINQQDPCSCWPVQRNWRFPPEVRAFYSHAVQPCVTGGRARPGEVWCG